MKFLDLFRHRKSKYYDLIGYNERDSALIHRAFCHSSLARTDEQGNLISNERLEYLGDAVIELVVSDMVYRQYPARNEGFLTMSRSLMVRRTTLNDVSRAVGLDAFIEAKQPINSEDIYGNAFEALVGAIYLDGGYERASAFVQHSFNHIKLEKLLRTDANYKSALYEYAQHDRLSVEFRVMSSEKLADNSSRFRVEVLINGDAMGQGIGSSKKQAEQAAAKVALSTLKKQQ